MTETQTLLADYASGGSEPAFRELVRRYVDLVYSTAVRLVNGDRHLAEDVAQTVFIDLARAARTLPPTVMLGGWLHRHTCFVAAKTIRSERRRQNRERQAMEMTKLRDDSEADLAHVAPILDEAINELEEDDRTAILLRFFERRDFRSVGEALGGKEDAARMRVNRALEKLEALLRRRGVAYSTAALGTVLATEAVTAAPSALAATLAGTVLAVTAGHGAPGGLAFAVLKTTAMTKLKLGVLGTLILGSLATPVVIQHQRLLNARGENEALRDQVGRMPQLEAENGRLSNLVARAADTEALSRSEQGELLRLRNEVGRLRRQVADVTRSAPANPNAQNAGQRSETTITADNYYKEAGIAKLNYTKNWMLAFQLFAEKNQGQFPTNFNQALSFLPDGAKFEHDLAPDEFRPGTPKYGLIPDNYEIVYQGPPDIVTPQNIIVLREKEAWQGPDGGWLRTYAFADGHTELHHAVDGDFKPWEAQHMVAPER